MNKKVITPSDALGAYERAFRSGNPREVEELLREMLNVQVAVVNSKEDAETQILQGKRLKTVSVPYGVFLEKHRGKEVYRLDLSALKKQKKGGILEKVGSFDEIVPNRTYVLLSSEAGYSKDCGLTFEGPGDPTGFEDEPNAERQEKWTEGRFQAWDEHAKGVWGRSECIAELYRPFVERWVEQVLGLRDQGNNDFVEAILWAMRMAVYLHDVGKLNQEWQDTMWKNEQEISGRSRCGFIARTSPVPNEQVRNKLKPAPFHAPFAYPFVKAFLRSILGDYRFLDHIALASARHHSLEVTGAIEKGEFEWAQNPQDAEQWLHQEIQRLLQPEDEDEEKRLKRALEKASQAIVQASKADEPPGPTDDFYFLYCLANRLVKVCDWEDAGQQDIELR